MKPRTRWLVAAVLVVVIALVVRNQSRKWPSANAESRRQAMEATQRQVLFSLLQPVALSNCELARFGETHDGGYLMCGNLLGAVQSGYSYGIAGYDKWGCDISTKLGVAVHQHDCFNTTQPECPDGKTVFHPECVGPGAKTEEGRSFDTIESHIAKNGDTGKRIVMKIDVEGAEWDSFLSAPDEVLQQFDQIAVEFHWVQEERYRAAVQRLKQFFHIAHLHFNNASCIGGLDPFPTWAYEVLFVSKRLGIVDSTRKAGGLHPLDAPNNPTVPDCQPVAR